MFYSENAYRVAFQIMSKLFSGESEDKLKERAQETLSIAYSIGGDYSEKTLTEIAKAYYKITEGQNDNSES